MKQEEYVQGKWYVVFTEKYYFIIRCQYVKDGKMWSSEVYFSDGDRDFLLGNSPIEKVIGLANPAQIETCLKAYAQKNGYINGAQLKQDGVTKILNDKYYPQYWAYNDSLGIGGACVYSGGKWAEIIAHAPSVQDKQDQELTERIHEYLTNQDLEKMSVLINGHSVSLLKCVEVYQLCLGIKTVIG